MKKSPRIICLMGPTATGKTRLAIDLVEKLPCDIISVDSGMVYRGMDIGTAKPTQDELARAPHRLIDIRDPAEPYSAAEFRADALREIELILENGRIPLLVGGTMLYFRVLQEGLSDLPSADQAIRAQLLQEKNKKGLDHLHKRLARIDPEAATRIKPTDSQRILRALEVYDITGETLTALCSKEIIKGLPYEVVNIALKSPPRVVLHERIAKRFDQMLAQGLIDEVKGFFDRGDLTPDLPAMRAVGYRQVWRYLSGEYNQVQMRERAIIATRQLAKHQMTWLRGWPNVITLEAEAVLSSGLIG